MPHLHVVRQRTAASARAVEVCAWGAWLAAAASWWTRNLPRGDETPLPLMADSSFVAEFSHDLVSGRAAGWSFPPAPSLVPEVPLHLVFEFLTGDWRVAMFCGGLAIWLAATLALRFATGTAVAVALMAVVMTLAARGELRAPISLLLDANHGWTAVLAFVGLWWPTPRLRWLQVASAGLIAASDPWLHVYLSAPLIVLSLLRRRPVGVIWVVSALVGSAFGGLLFPHGSLSGYLDVPPARIIGSLFAVATHAARNASAASALLVGLLAVGARGRPLPLLGAAASVTVTIGWALFIDDLSVRYWGVVLLGGLAGLALLGSERSPWVVGGALVVSLLGLSGVDHSGSEPLRGWMPSFVRCLRGRSGLGDYWSSRQGRLAGLEMISVTEDGDWNPWISHRGRAASLERVEFVVLSGLNERAFGAQRLRGTTERCGGLTVWYPTNEEALELARGIRSQHDARPVR